jgi:hypothetical protein
VFDVLQKKESNYQEKLHEVLSLKRERTAVSNGLDIRHADRLKIFSKFSSIVHFSFLAHCIAFRKGKVSPSPEAAPWPFATGVL